jgi:cardiolipin synthase A/B
MLRRSTFFASLTWALVVVAAACNTATLDAARGLPPDTSLPDGGDASSGARAADAESVVGRDASATDGGGGPADGASGYTTQVSILVGPGDAGEGLLGAIQSAKTSVHMTMYLLTNDSVIEALIAQKEQRHEVKVLLNQNFPQGDNGNAPAYNRLTSAGVNVVWASDTYTFTHEKCVILDGATAWIMTMNATKTSPTNNREFLAVDTDPADVAVAEQIFQGDFAHAPVSATGKLVVAPLNAKARLLALLASARASIDLEGEELSDTDVVSSLTERASAGVNVRVVVSNESPTPAQAAAIQALKDASVPIVKVSTPYIHAKAIVVDGTYAYVGSVNFTRGSMQNNRELGVLIDGTAGSVKAEVSKVSTAIEADFARGVLP